MLWTCLLYKLSRKIFWFQSNFALFLSVKKRGKIQVVWNCRGPATPSPSSTT